jgi:hypothetical protein
MPPASASSTNEPRPARSSSPNNSRRALDSRILIEQAKGFLTHSLSVGPDDAPAAARLRPAHNRPRTDVADDFVRTVPASPPPGPHPMHQPASSAGVQGVSAPQHTSCYVVGLRRPQMK